MTQGTPNITLAGADCRKHLPANTREWVSLSSTQQRQGVGWSTPHRTCSICSRSPHRPSGHTLSRTTHTPEKSLTHVLAWALHARHLPKQTSHVQYSTALSFSSNHPRLQRMSPRHVGRSSSSASAHAEYGNKTGFAYKLLVFPEPDRFRHMWQPQPTQRARSAVVVSQGGSNQ
jgi:hypothetical protein